MWKRRNYLSEQLNKLLASSFFREFSLFSLSTITIAAVKFVVNIASANFVGPKVWGTWYILNLVLLYSVLFQLGVLNGMNRDIPFFKGRRDTQKVEQIRSVALGFILGVAIFTLSVLLLVALFLHEPNMKYSMVFLALLVAVNHLALYMQIYLKSEGRFSLFSVQQLIFAILQVVAVLPLAYFFGLEGFILGQAGATFLVVVFIAKSIPCRLVPAFDLGEVLRLARVGFPIMMLGLVSSLISTIDRFMVSTYLGVEQLGYYTLALMALTAVAMLPLVIAQQIYPRMVETWGRTTNVLEIRRWVWRQVSLSLGVVAPVILVVYLSSPFLVRVMLPEYELGLPSVGPLILSSVPMAFISGFANMLNTLGRQTSCLIVQAVALVPMVGLNLLVLKAGWGIVGVAWATTVSMCLYSLMLLWVGHKTIKELLPCRDPATIH